MAGPVLHRHGEMRERSVSWASRSAVDSPPRRVPPSARSTDSTQSALPRYFSPGEANRYEESPLPIEYSEASSSRPHSEGPARASAPAILHHPHRPLSKLSAGLLRHGEMSYQDVPRPAGHTTRQAVTQGAEHFELDPTAPIRAVKHHSADTSFDALLPPVDEEEEKHPSREGSPPTDAAAAAVRSSPQSSPSAVAAAEQVAGNTPPVTEDPHGEGPVWGEPFPVEWIRTDRLPFYRTRNLRNPWNHDREVKVSRDGTELEPSVGQALLDEWDKPEPPPPPQPGAKSVSPPDARSEA